MKDVKEKKKKSIDQRSEERHRRLEKTSNKTAASDRMRTAKDTRDVTIPEMRPEERLARRDRIERNDAMRHLPGYDVNKAEALENKEIATNADAFERRSLEHGLDRATERRIKLERIKQDRAHGKIVDTDNNNKEA